MPSNKKKLSQRGLVQVNARLLEADIAEIKRRAAAEAVRWQIKLRSLVHEALTITKKDGLLL